MVRVYLMSVHSKVLLDLPPPHHHHHHHNHHTQKCSKNQHTREFEDVPLLSLCTLYLHACQVRVTVDVPVVQFMYLVFTRMPGESYCECTSDGVYVPCIYTHAR